MATIESDHCIVVLIDMLGARTVDKEVTERLYHNMSILRDSVNSCAKNMLEYGDEVIGIGPLPQPQVMVFGDTLLFLWNIDEATTKTQQGPEEPMCPEPARRLPPVVGEWLPIVGQLFSFVFVDALRSQIPLRGAISHGYVKYDTHVALGPAISDAAEWYEDVDALAVVATPRTGLTVDDVERKVGPQRLSHALVKHDKFTLKRQNEPRPLWTVSWPPILHRCARVGLYGVGEEDTRGWVLDKLGQFPMPYGTERKYYEALNVFDAYERLLSSFEDSQDNGR